MNGAKIFAGAGILSKGLNLKSTNRLKLAVIALSVSAIALSAWFLTVPVLVHVFHVPPAQLPEPPSDSTTERACQIKLPLNKIAQSMKSAILAAEDRRFYQHHGIDALGAIRAMIDNAKAGHMIEGGSTITQQLAKNLFLDWRKKTASRKIQQMLLAWELESRYSKQQILEAYLNEVYFGNGCFGVERAAIYYFDKHAADLDLAESAFLAGLVQAPSEFGLASHRPRALAKQREVLIKMKNYGLADNAAVEQACQERLHFH